MSRWLRWQLKRPPAVPTGAPEPAALARPGKWALLARLRKGVGDAVMGALEGVASAGAFLGAPVALAMGRVFLAVLLVAVGTGVLLRLGVRSRRCKASVSLPALLPLWQHLLAAVLSVVGVAMLVEVTRLPVRARQRRVRCVAPQTGTDTLP